MHRHRDNLKLSMRRRTQPLKSTQKHTKTHKTHRQSVHILQELTLTKESPGILIALPKETVFGEVIDHFSPRMGRGPFDGWGGGVYCVNLKTSSLCWGRASRPQLCNYRGLELPQTLCILLVVAMALSLVVVVAVAFASSSSSSSSAGSKGARAKGISNKRSTSSSKRRKRN